MQTLYFDLRDTKGQQKEIEDKISAAAQLLREGGLVGIPTETVYGLGANGLDGGAVNRIFEAKGRPQDNPLILHVTGAQWLPRYCADIPPIAYVLARKFWPGPLTMILKRKPGVVPDETTAGLDTVGMRCPNHPVTLSIIREAGVPIAAPSANTSGRPSCTTAQDVLEDMDGKIEGVVDGGPCTVGVESTILDLTCEPPRLLRPGGLPLEDLERFIGHIDVDKAVTQALAEGEQPKAPGMKYRHYAPEAPVTVVTGAPEASAREIQKRVKPGDGVICFDEFAHLFREQEVHKLGNSSDKLTQAQRVFDALRTFDGSGVTEIYAQCPDNRGLGLAVGNRLKKAAGFHVVEAAGERVVLGITGGTGAGKTSALRAIEDLGGTVIDCDAVYHEMLENDRELREAIGACFPGVFRSDGTLDRKKLGQEVFAKKDRLERLNDIVYRFLVPEVERRLRGAECGLYAVDAINLLESGLDRLCDQTVAVTAPTELRVRRVMARDGITEQYARLRISAQKPDEYYRSKCGCELNNAAETPEAFREEARLFFTRLIETIKEEKPMEKSEFKELKEQLLSKRKNGWDRMTESGYEQAMEAYCGGYKAFLDAGKTERLCAAETIRLAEEQGYKPYVRGMELKPGDKVYTCNRGKAVMLAHIGEKSLADGAQIAAAHIDSPRLDLKPNPLYEESELAYFKTHYYGGIRKYQWVTIPLELRGVVALRDGSVVEVNIGGEAGDPKLVITDLLPHLGQEQSKKPLGQAVPGETLNLLLGSQPIGEEEESGRVKLAAAQLLHEKYGITEDDFTSAELEAVPAVNACDIGLDRSMIGAYGHDDRVCGYAALAALLDLEETPAKTAVCVLADKEEIGSDGVTGMQSAAFDTFMEDLCDSQGVALRVCFEKSFCLSADVTAAYDPNYGEVYEKRNAAYLSYGIGLCKYTGARGKSGASDADAETVACVRNLFDEAGVVWQIAELGKVDAGGGGTVAMYMANRNITTLDAGVPVLSMHAPFETVSKLDCYETYKGMRAVYQAK